MADAGKMTVKIEADTSELETALSRIQMRLQEVQQIAAKTAAELRKRQAPQIPEAFYPKDHEEGQRLMGITNESGPERCD